jgi:hypothetical protein
MSTETKESKPAADSAKAPAARRGAPAPTVGRTVHYYDREEVVEGARREKDPDPFPAIIRRVRNAEGACDLTVFTDYGPRNVEAVPNATKAGSAGSWTWPPLV